jgi:ABC-2 type transport system permease protein
MHSFLLFKIQLINQYRLNNFWKSSNAAMLNVVVLGIVFSSSSLSAAYSLVYMNLGDYIPAYAVAAGALASFFFTLFKTNGYLFGFRDYDMLMSLPVKITDIVASRFLLVYFTNLLFTIFLVLPMGIGYIIWVKSEALVYLYWLTAIFIIPLIPTILGVVLGAVVMSVSTRSRHTKAVSTILTVILLIGVLSISMFGGGMAEGLDLESMDDINRLVEASSEDMSRFYPLAGLFGRSFASGGFVYFLLFLFLGFEPYLTIRFHICFLS